MQELSSALSTALQLIVTLDPDLIEIVGLSLVVSLSAVALAAVIGLPLGPRWRCLPFPGGGSSPPC